MPTQPATRRHRLRPRLRLWGLMGLVVMFAAGLGWIVHQAKVQRDAVAAIERAGGGIRYNWQQENRCFPNLLGTVLDKPPGVPRWLVRWLGPDYFCHVDSVVLDGKGTDADLEHIGRLTSITYLLIGDNQFTDAVLVHLRDLTSGSLGSPVAITVSDRSSW